MDVKYFLETGVKPSHFIGIIGPDTIQTDYYSMEALTEVLFTIRKYFIFCLLHYNSKTERDIFIYKTTWAMSRYGSKLIDNHQKEMKT